MLCLTVFSSSSFSHSLTVYRWFWWSLPFELSEVWCWLIISQWEYRFIHSASISFTREHLGARSARTALNSHLQFVPLVAALHTASADSWKRICFPRGQETQTFPRFWPHNQEFQKSSGIYGLASKLSGTVVISEGSLLGAHSALPQLCSANRADDEYFRRPCGTNSKGNLRS